MKLKEIPVRENITTFLDEVVSSYAILFFSNNRILGSLIFIVTFFKPMAGLAGLMALLFAIAFARYTGINCATNQKGLFTFNALMMGIGMGTYYNPGWAFWVLLGILVILTVVFSSVLYDLLSSKGLPFLALPFIFCFWLVILVSREFEAINLTTRNIYWINETYNIGQKPMVSLILFFEDLPFPYAFINFFKSISALLFQENVLAGMIIFIGLLLHSRISATLMVLGFAVSVLFNHIMLAMDSGATTFVMGANFIMVALAIGSFFVIPSLHSYLWAMLSVPLTFIISIALSKITLAYQLPIYTLPFCFVTLTLLFFFGIKKQIGRVVLTPVQNYSPEKNLYSYLNNKERRTFEHHIPLQLPFLGEWIVSQGYDGNITHKGEWSKALDFVIVDAEMKTYTKYALQLDNFYCYNKPLLSPGYGYVMEIVDDIEDNEVGKINQAQNWGNTIIIKHAEGLFTKMSHLKKNSFKVKVGDYVKPGDMVAAIGNSGRSPEPHLHFQVQVTPYIGSKTLAYPFAFYKYKKEVTAKIAHFQTPEETEFVSNATINEMLSKAFEFKPGFRMEVQAASMGVTTWEVFTDALNYNYIYCYVTKAVAYFVRTNDRFYFISFTGPKESLLYCFYLSAYKVSFITELEDQTHDSFPLQLSKNNPGKWLQDMLAPFYIFRKLYFDAVATLNNGGHQTIEIQSKQTLRYFNTAWIKSTSAITITNSEIASFQLTKGNKTIQAQCRIKR